MRVVALVLLCLARRGHGRRLQLTSEPIKVNHSLIDVEPLSPTRRTRVNAPVKSFAALLVTLHDPVSGWQGLGRTSRIGCEITGFSYAFGAGSPMHHVAASRDAFVQMSAGSDSEAGLAANEVRAAEELLLGSVGRDRQARQGAESAIGTALDVLERDGGISSPVDNEAISGEWELVYTSKSDFNLAAALGSRVDGTSPGLENIFRQFFGGGTAPSEASSSPIQRTVTAIEGVTVMQNIDLTSAKPRVDQYVLAGDVATLRLSASASVSDPSRRRIDFQFDLGYATLNSMPNLKVPYPVPFKLLGDEAKGWLDTTYLSERLRVSKGNKGTTFVLRRK